MTQFFYITTPIFYVNAEPHIGHTYTSVVVDTLARYHRLAGEQTFYLTGTDEHGDKIAEAAAAKTMTPLEFADQISGIFRSTWDEVGFSYDRFIRTTEREHQRTVQSILQKVYDAGDIEFREYEGSYCVGCERFLTDRDLVDGRCRDHERAPELRRESNYFFRLSKYRDWLVQHIQDNPDFIRPERYKNEVLGMLREDSGLDDLCISRPKERLHWGIPLPFDENYVCYVWFDALINYLTGIGYPDAPHFNDYWCVAEHVIGKDILKPHGVFWPMMLKAAGLEPFQHLNVHGFWNLADRKISKSLGNMVSPLVMKEKYGFDAFRYFLLREMSFGLDAAFSEAALIARINADLANNLGNLVNRTLNMVGRYSDGKVPQPGKTGELEDRVSDAAARTANAVDTHVRSLEMHRALAAIFDLVNEANRYLETRAPWTAAKDPALAEQVRTTLYTACEALRVIAILLEPFLPATAPAILDRLGYPEALHHTKLPNDAIHWGKLPTGLVTQKGTPLFPRIEVDHEGEAAGNGAGQNV